MVRTPPAQTCHNYTTSFALSKGLRRLGPDKFASRSLHLFCTTYTLSGRPLRSPTHPACCLGFFAFLRSGEFTCPSARAYNGSMLSPADIAVDNRDHPTSLTVPLKASKTDVFQAGHSLLIGTTGDLLCPVAAILGYLAIRPDGPGPLFIYKDGTPLSRSRLVQAVRSALTSIGTIDLSPVIVSA